MSLCKEILSNCPSCDFRHRCLVPLSTEREAPLENWSRNFSTTNRTRRNLFLHWYVGGQIKLDVSFLKLAHVSFLCVLEAPPSPTLLLRCRRAAIFFWFKQEVRYLSARRTRARDCNSTSNPKSVFLVCWGWWRVGTFALLPEPIQLNDSYHDQMAESRQFIQMAKNSHIPLQSKANCFEVLIRATPIHGN